MTPLLLFHFQLTNFPGDPASTEPTMGGSPWKTEDLKKEEGWDKREERCQNCFPQEIILTGASKKYICHRDFTALT